MRHAERRRTFSRPVRHASAWPSLAQGRLSVRGRKRGPSAMTQVGNVQILRPDGAGILIILLPGTHISVGREQSAPRSTG